MSVFDWRLGLAAAYPAFVVACAAPVEPDSQSFADDRGETAASSQALGLDATVASIERIEVRVPKRFNVPYTGPAEAELPDGLPLSLGSGLRLKDEPGCRCGNGRDGAGYTLVGLSDRGPNGDAPDYLDAASVKHPSKSYIAPSFTPRLVTVRVRHGAATVTQTQELRFGREPAVGLPPVGLTTEVGVDESLRAIAASEAGIDPEGLAFDGRGNPWISDEYGPSLLELAAHSGRVLRRLLPGAGLPAILASRQVNRGFEGVAVTPSGKIYGLVQSTLDVDNKTKATAQFIRLVEYDPRTRATRMFAYPHDVSAYKKSSDAKLGDLFALDDTHFLTLELGKDKDGNLRNIVYAFDIGAATDLTGITLPAGTNAGKELEYGTPAELASLITTAAKTLVVDLRTYGYTAEKSEGLALVDNRTLAVINDNDFGVTARIENDAVGGTDPTKYVVDQNGALTLDGAPSPGSYAIHALGADAQRTELFIVRLQQPLTRTCP